jgi:hypothetical protein
MNAKNTSHAPDCHCVWCRVERDNATTPTRAEMCATLARAMFPTAVIEPSLSGSGVDIRIYDKPNETRIWRNFDPFANAADNRALVEWLAEQSKDMKSKFGRLVAQSVSFSWEFEGENGTCTLWDHLQDGTLFEDHFVDLLSAPLPVVAEAAWRAIQEEAK